MLAIVGLIIVFGSVITGYVAHHGNLAILWQPTEFIIIGGAGLGSLVVSVPKPVLSAIGHQLGAVFKKTPTTTASYLELLQLLFELCKTAKANPLALEPHVEKPEESEIFKRYPGVLHNHHAVEFLCDTLKVQLSSSMSPYDLEDLMDTDIKAIHEEEHHAVSAMTKMSEAMPALGIVAAVLGVIITMGKLSLGKEVIGMSVAAALVGTFLGVLLCYGILGPIASKMEANNHDEGMFFRVIKSCLIAFAKDCSPKVCVEFARRSIPPDARPSFTEVDQATSNAGKAA